MSGGGLSHRGGQIQHTEKHGTFGHRETVIRGIRWQVDAGQIERKALDDGRYRQQPEQRLFYEPVVR